MNKKIYLNFCLLSFFFMISSAYFLNSRNIFGEKMFFDNAVIKRYLLDISHNLIFDDKSYGMVSYIYYYMGFRYNSSLYHEIIFSWIIYILICLYLGIRLKYDFTKIRLLYFFLLFSFLYGAYLSQLSKELLLTVFLMILLFVAHNLQTKKIFYQFILFFGFLLVYSYFFRSYWYFVAILYVFNFYLYLRKISFKKILILNTLLIIFICFLYSKLYGEGITIQRSIINETRDNSPFARSMLNNPLPPSNYLNDLINIIYMFINQLVPINGIKSISVILYYVWIYSCIYLVSKKLVVRNFITFSELTILCSFFIVQTFFEPDMGSLLRHQVPLSVFIFYIITDKT